MKRLHFQPTDLWWRAATVVQPESICANPPSGITVGRAQLDEIGSRFVLEIRNAKIIGEARLLATSDNKVIADIQGLHGVTNPEAHHYLESKVRLPKFLSGTSCILAGATEPNYYHWMFDCLPRLHLLKLAGYRFDDIDHFLLMNKVPKFVWETLQEMGVPKEKCVSLHSKEVLVTEMLIATEMPAPRETYCEWVIQFLKKLFKLPSYPTASNLVYLSRRNAEQRRVSNEAELTAALEEFGFATIHAEQFSVGEQADVFSKAKLILAPHGAGLTNILFSNPGTTVVEFYNPNYNVDCFRKLGRSLNQNVVRMECAPSGGESDPAEDMTVDIATLLPIIREALKS